MRLGAWLKWKGISQTQFGARIGASQQSVSAYCRHPYDPAFVDPPAVMKHRIWRETDGQVAPNDFYDLPALRRRMIAGDLYPLPDWHPSRSKPASGADHLPDDRPEHTKRSSADGEGMRSAPSRAVIVNV